MEPTEGLPPAWWGLSVTEPDLDQWRQKREIRDKIYAPVHKLLNEWRVSEGLPEHGQFVMSYWSPFLNIYNYPAELNYFENLHLPAKTIAIDACIRKVDEPFQLPAEFVELPGRTVYLSMGTLASVNEKLMEKFVNALKDTKHKYIVSKGVNGDRLQLPASMWGENFLPQTKLLPLVDLIITHGGNNTVSLNKP